MTLTRLQGDRKMSVQHLQHHYPEARLQMEP